MAISPDAIISQVPTILAFVWGAAKMHSAVQLLKETSVEFRKTLTGMADRLNQHGEAIARIEAKMD